MRCDSRSDLVNDFLKEELQKTVSYGFMRGVRYRRSTPIRSDLTAAATLGQALRTGSQRSSLP
jgi:hypothetical protein